MENLAVHYLKLGLLGAASTVPGAFGDEATTRYLRRRRAIAGSAAVARFEALLDALPTGSLCLDLGANVGEYTEKLARRAGHVHAFEPDPWTFEKLRERVGHLSNVTLHQKAIGTEDRVVQLRRPPHFEEDPLNASVGCSVMARTDQSWSTVDVEMVNFSRFIESLGQSVDIVKMDIEGAEVPVLEEFLQSPKAEKVVAMFVETHEVNMKQLRDRIKDLRKLARALSRPEVNLDWP